MMKKIMKRLDAWADSKTQEEFNEWVDNWIMLPLLILIAFAIMTIESWPL